MRASHHRPDSSPCALLFLLAPSICGVTAEHVQGRTSVLPEGEGWGSEGEWKEGEWAR